MIVAKLSDSSSYNRSCRTKSCNGSMKNRCSKTKVSKCISFDVTVRSDTADFGKVSIDFENQRDRYISSSYFRLDAADRRGTQAEIIIVSLDVFFAERYYRIIVVVTIDEAVR